MATRPSLNGRSAAFAKRRRATVFFAFFARRRAIASAFAMLFNCVDGKDYLRERE